MPLLLFHNAIEDAFRKRLSGLAYRMLSHGLLPDNRIVDWVVDSAQSTTMNVGQP